MTEKFSGGFVVVEKVIIESVNVGFKPIYVRQDGLSGLSDYVLGLDVELDSMIVGAGSSFICTSVYSLSGRTFHHYH